MISIKLSSFPINLSSHQLSSMSNIFHNQTQTPTSSSRKAGWSQPNISERVSSPLFKFDTLVSFRAELVLHIGVFSTCKLQLKLLFHCLIKLFFCFKALDDACKSAQDAGEKAVQNVTKQVNTWGKNFGLSEEKKDVPT